MKKGKSLDPIGKVKKTMSNRIEKDRSLSTPKGGSVSRKNESSYKKGISESQRSGRDAYERAAVEGRKLPTSLTKTNSKKIAVSNVNKMRNKK